MIDLKKFIQVVEAHGNDVTLKFLLDLLPTLGLRLTVKPIRKAKKDG